MKRIILVLLASLVPGCATTQVAGDTASSIEQATFAAGDRHYRIEACSSGDLQHFLGVDLVDRTAGASARVVIDPIDGARVRVVLPSGDGRASVVFNREQCSQLDADVRPTAWRVNTVRDVSGFVNAECRSAAGPAVSLHARFAHCH
jgi:hypothetical protein